MKKTIFMLGMAIIVASCNSKKAQPLTKAEQIAETRMATLKEYDHNEVAAVGYRYYYRDNRAECYNLAGRLKFTLKQVDSINLAFDGNWQLSRSYLSGLYGKSEPVVFLDHRD